MSSSSWNTGDSTYVQLARETGLSGDTAAKDIKTLYKAIYLKNRTPELVFQQFAQKQADTDIPLNKGDNVEYTRYAPLSDSPSRAYHLLAEGTTPDPEQYYAQTVTAVLDEYGNYVKPSSRLWLTAFDPKLGGLARLLGIQSGKSLDLKIQNKLALGFMGMRADSDTTYQGKVVIDAGTAAVPTFDDLPDNLQSGDTGVIVFLTGKNEGITRTYVYSTDTALTLSPALPYIAAADDIAWVCGTEGLASTDKITTTLIKKAVAKLEAQEAPLFPDGYYHAVIPVGGMKYDFMNDTEYINLKHYAAPKDLYRNLVGEFAGVRFHRDTHPYKHAAGTIATYNKSYDIQMITIFGTDAFGNVKLAGKDQVLEICPPEFSTATPMAMYGTMSWKNMYAPLVLNGAWGINIFCHPTDV